MSDRGRIVLLEERIYQLEKQVEAKQQQIYAGLGMLASIELAHKGPALSNIQRQALKEMVNIAFGEVGRGNAIERGPDTGGPGLR